MRTLKAMTCTSARRRLQAYHDGELAVSDQIAVAAHLDWCRSCAQSYDDLRAIGAALRLAQPGRRVFESAEVEQQVHVAAAVVNRLKAERNVSWPVGLKRAFEDAHFVYAGAAAVAAALVCVVVMLGMMRLATSTPRPDSLAALVNLLTPGSNENPVVPRASVQMPKPLDQAFSTESAVAGDDEAAFTLAAVVTREGRVANLELLRDSGDSVVPGTDEAKVVANLLDAVSRARFEPGSVAGLPVAVNMVWLVAHTTVRGSVGVPERRAQPPVKKRRIALHDGPLPVVPRAV